MRDTVKRLMVAPGDDLVARAQELVGQTLNEKWHLDALLGAGGMAAVYRATHRNGNKAAIKLLHAQFSMDAALRKRFLREGYVANSVDHAGAVQVLDDGVTDEGALYLVMELLEGMSLHTRWERMNRHFSPRETLSVAHSVLGILVAAHAKGIVHRDIKPDNIFLTKDKRIKLLDFGLARLREKQPEANAPKSRGGRFETPTKTKSGELLGTPAFMAPEQALARTEDIDARTDVWALGATMFTLLTGRAVHEAATPHEQLIMAATKQAPSVIDFLENLPDPVRSVVDRALAFNKVARWPDARSMKQAVEVAYANSPQDRRRDANKPDPAK
jgi:eukaryotic-like serine/threonine-protein kinase